MKNILDTVWAKLKMWFSAVIAYFKSLKNDTPKLLLTIILAVAIILSCTAVVTFTVKIVSGISNLFSGEEREALPLKEAATGSEPCATCTDGYCNLCTNGTLDCPDCEDGVCAKCGGEKSNQSKFGAMLFDNCLSCRGSGVCKTCDGVTTIDCEACTDGKCNTCVIFE